MHGEHFDCARCRNSHHCDDDYRWPGSRGPAGFPVFAIPGVIESHTCLLPLVEAQSWAWIRMYKHYKAGYLVAGGGLLDQSAAYLEAMEVIASEVAKLEREIRDGRNKAHN